MNTALLAVAASAAIFSVSALAQSPPAAPQPQVIIVLPETVIDLPVERIGSSEPGPQSPAAARQEAAAALAIARTDCRQETSADVRRSCLDEARHAHDRAMEAARQASRR